MSPARPRLLAGAAALSAGTLLLAACSGAGGTSSSSDHSRITYALPANFTPNWILPIGTAAHLNTNNISIANTLWEPLIAYDGSTGKIAWNKAGSIATAADFAPDDKSVTITLGDRHWSDGKPITSADVGFWFDLIKANKAQWAGYNPGKAPDNWTSFKTVDARHFTIAFDKAYNPQWMLANELSAINPLPRHVWDQGGDPAKTWTYLNDAAKNISGYASDPLWKTVSGPYTVKSFSTAGKVVLAANAKYDGGEKPGIPTVDLLPFTTADAEKNALRSGSVDYGYIEATDLDQKDSFTAQGYTVRPWSGWAITYMPYNFNNPAMGAVFKQLYARQAVQRSIDQASLAKVVLGGTAVPGYGPIPQGQTSDFLSPAQKANPYPYSTNAARALLTSHGWSEQGGVMTCTEPAQCGQGIARGTTFEMQVLSQSGSAVTDNMMSAIQSSLAKTGIKFTIKTAPVNSVLSQTPSCKASQAICTWQLSFFGTAGSWYFNAFPTGDSLFQSGGGSNFGGYSDPAVDQLISASTTSSSNEAIQQYSAALAQNLPVVWLPEPVYQISVMKNGLGGFRQDSLANFHPAQWKWTS
ncbi:peptide ABC transporter substrate-binding protein [Streptomyces acidiscabies]|uniref:peptide ABC transporter substrate-binding protein n=1 Tax=Streptomyces acidiscabies TaxID=42234 RepID=UPI0038F6083C